jgi:pSer/pThr/pTyr-binding forkhead associated (FHA) protein
MKITLINLCPGVQETRIVVDELPAVIGRGADADVRLIDCWASRVHCELSILDGTLVVRDLESRNGTLVNGEQITEAHLLPDDRLGVGITSMQVKYKRARIRVSAVVQHDFATIR